MEIRQHKVIRQTNLSKSSAQSNQAAEVVGGTEQLLEPNTPFPDISGLAHFGDGVSLAVRDVKMESDEKRFLVLHNETGARHELSVDWSKTGRPRDLEAVAPGIDNDSFLAVEGSSFGENKARLFELEITPEGGVAKRSIVLPEFGQEIEGLLSIPQPDGSQKVVFGGRGDENGAGRLFWGSLSEEQLKFNQWGLAGIQVDGPELGEGRRSISDLTLSNSGEIWATAAVDEGDEGPFTSAIYKVGQVEDKPSSPITISQDHSGVEIKGTKAEALVLNDKGEIFVGSDNESRGGRFEWLSLG